MTDDHRDPNAKRITFDDMTRRAQYEWQRAEDAEAEAKALHERIEQLERELAEAHKDNEIATRHVSSASEALSAVGAELAAEKKLADRMYDDWRYGENISGSSASLAYRKARGL